MCDVSVASCLVVNLDVDHFARVNSIGRAVCSMSCVVCCAWCVVACLLIGVGLDFLAKLRSIFLIFFFAEVMILCTFWLKIVHRNTSGHLEAILGLRLKACFLSSGQK